MASPVKCADPSWVPFTSEQNVRFCFFKCQASGGSRLTNSFRENNIKVCTFCATKNIGYASLARCAARVSFVVVVVL